MKLLSCVNRHFYLFQRKVRAWFRSIRTHLVKNNLLILLEIDYMANTTSPPPLLDQISHLFTEIGLSDISIGKFFDFVSENGLPEHDIYNGLEAYLLAHGPTIETLEDVLNILDFTPNTKDNILNFRSTFPGVVDLQSPVDLILDFVRSVGTKVYKPTRSEINDKLPSGTIGGKEVPISRWDLSEQNGTNILVGKTGQIRKLDNEPGTWYHGTTMSPFETMLRLKKLSLGSWSDYQDFGFEKSFYVGDSLKHAVEWAQTRIHTTSGEFIVRPIL